MRKLFTLLAVLAFATSASAQVLINDSLGVAPGDWTKVGDGHNARVSTNHDTGGSWAVGGSDGSGASAAYTNYYFQSFTLAPSVYTVDLSGWTKAYAAWWSGEDWQWVQEAHLELWIDGSKAWSAMSSNNTNRDTWTLHTHSADYAINNAIEIRLNTVKGNNQNGGGTLGAIYFDSRYDDIMLSVTPVPEPSSMLALGTGLMGLAGFAFRRRK